MPHIDVVMVTGRTEEQKKRLADAIAKAVSEIAVAPLPNISVAIRDCDNEDWKTEVWDKRQVPNLPYMYKKPGYTYDEKDYVPDPADMAPPEEDKND